MNQEQILGNWQQIKGKIQNKWGKITDDDLLKSEGKKDFLIGKLTERYGYSKEKASKKLDAYLQHVGGIGNKLQSFAQAISKYADNAKIKATETVKSCSKYAKDKPLTTVGIVAAVGVIVGMLIPRSHK